MYFLQIHAQNEYFCISHDESEKTDTNSLNTVNKKNPPKQICKKKLGEAAKLGGKDLWLWRLDPLVHSLTYIQENGR